MLPSFVITLREGLEASLIVGIVAAFLVREGRGGALKRMWIGVASAVTVCLAVGVALRIVDQQLPERGQATLETVIALVAVAMVTYMIVWMKQHARGLRGSLEGSAADAVAAGSAGALVAMAFIAVFREGFETSVFLLAVFQQGNSPVASGVGAVLGLLVAVAIGWGIYRGGVHLGRGQTRCKGIEARGCRDAVSVRTSFQASQQSGQFRDHRKRRPLPNRVGQ